MMDASKLEELAKRDLKEVLDQFEGATESEKQMMERYLDEIVVEVTPKPPIPGHWIKKDQPQGEPPVKRPYVRREHLTDRPLLHDEALEALKKDLHAQDKRNQAKQARFTRTARSRRQKYSK
jgi:hypothetical protein